jgi:hypothetical protein
MPFPDSMYQEQRAASGTTVTFALAVDPRIAPAAGFEWLVTPLVVTAGLVRLPACASARLVRVLPATIVPLGEGCATHSAISLSARFQAPAAPGDYRVNFLVKGIDDADLRIELDGGRLFVTPSTSLQRRGSLIPLVTSLGPYPGRTALLPTRYFTNQLHITDTYGLGRAVFVEIFDQNGVAISGNVMYSTDLNTLDIYFSQPVSGSYLLYSDRSAIQPTHYFANQVHIHDDYGLGRQVAVEIFDSSGLQVEADVEFSADLNSLDIFFSQPLTGSYQLY